MAISELGLTLDEFYDEAPRALVAMIDEWKEIHIYKAQVLAHIDNGGDPDDLRPAKPDILVNVFNVL